jgi:hypothetical protein
MRRHAVFVIDLVQDVTVLRPLIFMAVREFGFDAELLVCSKFAARDATGVWRHELSEIARDAGARIGFFRDDWEAHQRLTGQGIIFSASESSLPQHATTHNLFRHVPPAYLRVTVQHGYECVGFRHNADHARSHGDTVSFLADVLCSWTSEDKLTSMAPSQRPKVHVTGPTSALQLPTDAVEALAGAPGLVCENLHSVRFKGSRELRTEFLKALAEFASTMARLERTVVLRAHPGGQYAVRNRPALPPNVRVENAPLYRVDLRKFAYGISPPSSVLIDMLLAGIPTAVWRDRRCTTEAENYAGLWQVSTAGDWAEFARAAEHERGAILTRQRQFLEQTAMPLDPRDVFYRYADVFAAARRHRDQTGRISGLDATVNNVDDRIDPSSKKQEE